MVQTVFADFAIGIDGVLTQTDVDGAEVPIVYFSQKLNMPQRNYSVTELKCLAAVTGVKKFRACVESMQFKIVIDHARLQWVIRQTDLAERLARC